jgi:hypothetical protein
MSGQASSAAEVVTLRDGTALLGESIPTGPRGKLLFVVRRAWASEHAPAQLKAWKRAEMVWAARAVTQRRERLAAWLSERTAQAGVSDPVRKWIETEIKRLEDESERPPLVVAEIDRIQVRGLTRRSEDERRMLRQAWKGGITEPESKPVAELKRALEARGFALSDIDPAAIDDLLPLPLESDARWLARRAATEVKVEPALRFIRYLGFVLPEGANENAAGAVSAALASLKSLLDERPVDPLFAQLQSVGGRGRVGAIVTRLDMAEELSRVSVEATLWVRTGPDRWEPALAYPATVRTDAVGADEQQPIANDPQVQGTFKFFERMGLGELTPELKERGVKVGAAVRRALGMAQSALSRELENLALPIERIGAANGGEDPMGKPKP